MRTALPPEKPMSTLLNTPPSYSTVEALAAPDPMPRSRFSWKGFFFWTGAWALFAGACYYAWTEHVWNRFYLVMVGAAAAAGLLLVHAVLGRCCRGLKLKLMMVCLTVAGAIHFVKRFDEQLQAQRAEEKVYRNDDPAYLLHTATVYPYTGFQMTAHAHVKGPMPLEANPFYEDFDVRSGDHGFFVDFDLDNPPAKAPGEFRIILTGGSAAQGYGGQTNDHMLYRQLEKKLLARLDGIVKVRVINLAMASTITQQNFIALNKWGHRLQPDLILSFSGCNDTCVPLMTGCDMPMNFHGVWALERISWYSATPEHFREFADFFPGLNTTVIGMFGRLSSTKELGEKAWEDYKKAHGCGEGPDLERLAADLYAHALKSIKKDFMGIPMVVAFQPYGQAEQEERIERAYGLARRKARELDGFMNDQWRFIDVHDHFARNKMLGPDHLIGGVHLVNHSHAIAADVITAQLAPFVEELVQQNTAR